MHCLQSELEVDGLDNIHVYALHPGGTKSGLQGYLLSLRVLIIRGGT